MKNPLAQIRREQLRRLIPQPFKTQAAADEALGFAAGYTSLLLTEQKNMGEVLARRAEIAAGLPKDYFDELSETSSSALVLSDLDSQPIPQLDVSASMGDGAFPVDHVETVRNISVSVSELRKQCTFSSPGNLAFITGYGDSMEPTYRDGDLLLVDRGVSAHKIDGVHVLILNQVLYIKTLQRTPDGNVWMISDNKKYQPYLITAKDEVQIQGRVVLAWNARRL